jgi:hypothetical protein
MLIQLVGWRIGAIVTPPKQPLTEAADISRGVRPPKPESLFTLLSVYLLFWLAGARPAHTTDLMRAHYQQSTKSERK